MARRRTRRWSRRQPATVLVKCVQLISEFFWFNKQLKHLNIPRLNFSQSVKLSGSVSTEIEVLDQVNSSKSTETTWNCSIARALSEFFLKTPQINQPQSSSAFQWNDFQNLQKTLLCCAMSSSGHSHSTKGLLDSKSVWLGTTKSLLAKDDRSVDVNRWLIAMLIDHGRAKFSIPSSEW